MTKHERWLARRVTLKKYRVSNKNKENQRRYRKKHRKEISKKALEWQHKNIVRVRKLIRLRLATPEGKAKRDASSKRYAVKNRIKRLAKDAVHNAIRAGKMIKKPCKICGENKVEGHHPDYTKPLEVVWLCDKHHTEVHCA